MSDSLSKKVAERFLLEAMSNLTEEDTGIEGVVIWVSAGEFGGVDLQHVPRVKVVLGTKIRSEGLDKAVTCTLTDPPRVLGALPGKSQKQVLAFLRKNRPVLRRYWNNEVSTREMLDLVESV